MQHQIVVSSVKSELGKETITSDVNPEVRTVLAPNSVVAPE